MQKRSSSLDARNNEMKAKMRHTDHYNILGVGKDSTDN
jgi:hypothetical protein